jgi:hypothetical protein
MDSIIFHDRPEPMEGIEYQDSYRQALHLLFSSDELSN